MHMFEIPARFIRLTVYAAGRVRGKDMLGLKTTSQSKAEFEALAMPCLDGLYASALRLTHSDRDAEDLVQDAFMRAYRFFDKFQRGTNFRAWLFKILTNTFINKYRRTVKERTFSEGSERESVTAQLYSADSTERAANPEDHLVERLMSQDILGAIDLLPIDFRMVVILADLQEFSYREIAEILDVPVGTVMSRLFRGRKLLQKQLSAYAEGDANTPIDLAHYRARKNIG
jgi:RNA polymerase sigma-70 factor (ECF subfamily)